MHCWDPRTPLEETLSTLDDLVREGKVRYIGASNFAGWQLAKALGLSALHGWEPFVSPPAASTRSSPATSSASCSRCAGRKGSRVLPWSPLAGGILTGKYRKDAELPDRDPRRRHREPDHVHATASTTGRGTIVDAVGKVAAEVGKTPAQVALNWVLHRPGVTPPIIGARNLAQLDDNLGAIGWPLDADHVAALEAASGFDIGYPYNFVEMISRR